MTVWKAISSAPRDNSMFVACDIFHGRLFMRQRMEGTTLVTETWAIDASGILEPPEPHLWTELPEHIHPYEVLSGALPHIYEDLPSKPCQENA